MRLQFLLLGSQPGDGQSVAASVVRIFQTNHALGGLGRLHAFFEPVNLPSAAAVCLSAGTQADPSAMSAYPAALRSAGRATAKCMVYVAFSSVVAPVASSTSE